MSKNILEANNLRTYYKGETGLVYAVDDVSFKLGTGKVLGIAGESGCGKSTLALSLMGLFAAPLYYDSGEIIINGADISSFTREKLRIKVLGKEIAYIPQSAMNALNPTLKIKDFIFDIMKEHYPKIGKKEVYQLARQWLTGLNLDERVLDSYPNQLSGGMKQRTVIAISTIMKPDILVADEPTSALDVSSQKIVMEMLISLLKKEIIKSMIFITHELPLLYHIADEIIIMYAGQFVERGTANEVIFNPLHPYSRELMTSIIVPEDEFKDKELSAIPGTPPNLAKEIIGCRFAERCKYVTPDCLAGEIKIRQLKQRYYKCIREVEPDQKINSK